MSSNRDQTFYNLCGQAKLCTACKRMDQSIRVIGPASGSLAAPIFIVGEAPGRLGADASAIPFHGDRAGDNFEALIEQVGLSRHDCFVTNAALCNPRDEKGNNATPTRSELLSCSTFLRRQIDLVNPKIIVTLGAQALNALRFIEDHSIELSTGVRKNWSWYGRALIPLYHPGQRAMIHRSFLNQLADYRFLAEIFRRSLSNHYKTNSNPSPTSETIASIARNLASGSGISYFALHKLFYLAECEHYRRTKKRMTSAYIVRQKDGPYIFEMHIKKLKKAIQDLKVWDHDGKLMLKASEPNLFENASSFSEELEESLKLVQKKYRHRSEAELKRIVYLTAPMREMLRKEKLSEPNTFNQAIDFSIMDRALG